MDLRIFVEAQQGASYDQQLSVALAAEDAGFDAFFRSDHYMAMGGGGLPGPTDAWTTLAGIARETSRLRLGTLVSPATFRLPGPLAITVAQVDAMSGGRVELGIGTGWYDAEHAAYAIPFPPLGARFEMLEEQLEIVHGLWSTPEGERFGFEGRYYAVEESPALPKPVQQPHPPIIMGGRGEKRTPRLAARFADEFNAPPFSTIHVFTDLRARVSAACEAAGRDPGDLTFSAAVMVCCGADEGEVVARAARIGQQPDTVRQHGAGGLPPEVVDTLARWRDAGAERLYLQLVDPTDAEQVQLLGAEVLPQLR